MTTFSRLSPLFLVALGFGCTSEVPREGTSPSSVGAASGLFSADSAVADWVDAGRVTGAVLRVTRGGEVEWEQSSGFAERFDFGVGQYPPSFDAAAPGAGLSGLPTPVPMTVATVFDLASVTKVMATTMAMMVLTDRGDIDLEAPVSRYLTDFAGGGKEAITITHLLTHRSGLEQWKPTYYHADNADEAYAYIRELPLAWTPGAERHYSDFGFILLGRIVEHVSGKPLNDFVADEVYTPLGLRTTGYLPTRGPYATTSHGNPFERRMVYEADFGYQIEGDPTAWDDWREYSLTGEVNDGNAHHAFGGVAGHAGLFSTASDLSVLLELLLDDGRHGDGAFISDDVIDRFLATTGNDQALGWQNPPYALEGSFGHTGFTGTFVMGVPSQDLAIVLLTNRQNGGVDAGGEYPDVGTLQRAVVEALTR